MATTKKTNVKKNTSNKKNTKTNEESYLIVKMKDRDKFSIEGKIIFNSQFSEEEGTLTSIHGQIITDYFLNDTELESIRSWRFLFSDIKMISISGDSDENNLVYVFSAKSFDVVV